MFVLFWLGVHVNGDLQDTGETVSLCACVVAVETAVRGELLGAGVVIGGQREVVFEQVVLFVVFRVNAGLATVGDMEGSVVNGVVLDLRCSAFETAH